MATLAGVIAELTEIQNSQAEFTQADLDAAVKAEKEVDQVVIDKLNGSIEVLNLSIVDLQAQVNSVKADFATFKAAELEKIKALELDFV